MLAAACLLAAYLPAADPIARPSDVVWIEAEAPTRQAGPFQVGERGRTDYLSGGQWLVAAVDPADVPKKVPPAGAAVGYEFRPVQPGRHEVWARVGYEFARSPFRWRIDTSPWAAASPNELTTDLMAVADGAEVAWLRLGAADLAAGKHSFEIEVPRPAKGDRLVFGLDCVCLAPGRFLPDGPRRPGADNRTPVDRAAARTVFEFPAAVGLSGPEVRRAVDLAGVWQVARYDEDEIVDRAGPIAGLPADLDRLPWKGIRVPGDKNTERPDLQLCHRYLLRTRVAVPPALAGRSFVLRFPNNALTTTVWVNGQRCGFSKAAWAPFECDVSAAVRPGENTIVVGIKDLHYAVARTADGKSCRHLFHLPADRLASAGGPARLADFPVLFKARRGGILEAPALVAAGPVYAADVFAVPSVGKKELGLEVSVHNPSARPVAVEVRNAVLTVDPGRGPVRGRPAKTFAPATVTVPAGGTEVVKLAEGWPNPRLWWPDDPHQYVVETVLHVAGRPADEALTPFGFREWGTAGRAVTLNGVPWQLRADNRHADRPAGGRPDLAVAEWRRNGQTMARFRGDVPWAGASQRDTLNFFDAAGVPVRRAGNLPGELAGSQPDGDSNSKETLFDNWRHQLAARVKAERNHPSLFAWSLDAGPPAEVERAVALVRALDSTRAVLVDGGVPDPGRPVATAPTPDPAGPKRDYPDLAYTVSRTVADDRPLVLDGNPSAAGGTPAAYAEVAGEAAFLGRREAAAGATRFARMLSEGYRWAGVAGFHLPLDEGPDADHYRAWQPVGVLAREWNTSLPAGGAVTRTLKVFNDTRVAAPITVHWLFQTRGGRPVQQRGKRVFPLRPGAAEEFAVELTTPGVGPDQVVPADLILTCERDGKEVFRDTKPVRVVGPPAELAPQPGAPVVLWDPTGKGAKLLAGVVAAAKVGGPDEAPTNAVLVVGPDAVTPGLSTDPRWKALAARGVRVVVLDQTHPLHYQALPADLEPAGVAGRVGFPDDRDHPAVAGLTAADFFCWSGDHVVYRNAYRKPTRGGRSVVQCDVELGCTAVAEVPVGDGVLLLCQLAVGDKPADPVARRVVANLVRYAAGYRRAARPTAVVLPAGDPRRKLLAGSGLRAARLDDPVEALAQAEVVVADASPGNLSRLAATGDRVREFTAAGGWLVLWGVTPDGLADFNRLVGFPHALRPVRAERVTLPAARDPVLAGVGPRDVAAGPAGEMFTHAVDLDDPAPFVKSDRWADGWAKMTDGRTSADSEAAGFLHDLSEAGARPSWAGRLPKPEEVTGLSVVVNTRYRALTKLRAVFDGNPATAVTLALKPEAELRQEFEFPARRCRAVALEPVEWTDGPKPVVGLDEVRLRVRRPADFKDRVVPLLSIGALVKYPQGKGGVLLVQVRGAEADPDDPDRKRHLVATLLRNLGAEFAADRVVVPGANLATTPVPLGGRGTTYLTADKGWPGAPADLGHFPAGDREFAGVRYAVRDAVALAPGAPAVKGVPVGRPADALFFLHTFVPAKGGGPAADGTAAPVVARYVVTYSDGGTVAVPVRLGRGVGPWVADAAKPLPDAAVGWAAPFPAGKGPAGKQAVVYQLQWTNPYPKDEIVSVDLVPDPAGARVGTTVVLGITAGAERK